MQDVCAPFLARNDIPRNATSFSMCKLFSSLTGSLALDHACRLCYLKNGRGFGIGAIGIMLLVPGMRTEGKTSTGNREIGLIRPAVTI